MQTGKINVQTENIFPVIKKFLYSDHEIFLRELISNAVDATQKLKTLVSLGKADCELGDLTIDVKVNKDDKTIHVTDRGIGMTAEEVDRYINQIAFSGAEDFLAKYKGNDAANIIGHFGLGFYSSFMVANRVDILTKSYQKDAQAVKWSCDGSPDFTLEEIDKSDRGTEIVLHVEDDDLQEFVNEDKLVELLNKYCRFLPVPIRCGMKTEWRKPEQKPEDTENKDEKKEEPKEEAVQVPRIINDTDPIWQKQP
ncbi:MAG: ATP-binding protein, partial [Bacteroidales bacterium]|nr:ATP-binding protein [Bacteroidales bacterium]